jgi:hypothetical protein
MKEQDLFRLGGGLANGDHKNDRGDPSDEFPPAHAIARLLDVFDHSGKRVASGIE